MGYIELPISDNRSSRHVDENCIHVVLLKQVNTDSFGGAGQ